MREIFIKGGPIMWPLLICSVISIATILERFVFWLKVKRRIDRQTPELIFSAIESGDFSGAEKKSAESADYTVRVLSSGLAHRKAGYSEAMETTSLEELEEMKRGMMVLDTIITMAPLLGLLGTVVGIIFSFKMLGSSSIMEPQAVVGGIAEALITTVSGIAVALMTLVPYNYFILQTERATSRISKFATRLEAACKRIEDESSRCHH